MKARQDLDDVIREVDGKADNLEVLVASPSQKSWADVNYIGRATEVSVLAGQCDNAFSEAHKTLQAEEEEQQNNKRIDLSCF